jgi:hypothetical protein
VDALAEMHLLLREYGWVSEYHGESEDGHGRLDYWTWAYPQQPGITFSTLLFQDPLRAYCGECSNDTELRADSLRRRLQELAKQ